MNNKLHRCFICPFVQYARVCMYIIKINPAARSQQYIIICPNVNCHKIGKCEVFDINVRFVYPFANRVRWKLL